MKVLIITICGMLVGLCGATERYGSTSSQKGRDRKRPRAARPSVGAPGADSPGLSPGGPRPTPSPEPGSGAATPVSGSEAGSRSSSEGEPGPKRQRTAPSGPQWDATSYVPIEGEGVYEHADGTVWDGVWTRGHPREGARFMIIYENGAVYKGQVNCGGQPHGMGTLRVPMPTHIDAAEFVFTGPWENGMSKKNGGGIFSKDMSSPYTPPDYTDYTVETPWPGEVVDGVFRLDTCSGFHEICAPF